MVTFLYSHTHALTHTLWELLEVAAIREVRRVQSREER